MTTKAKATTKKAAPKKAAKKLPTAKTISKAGNKVLDIVKEFRDRDAALVKAGKPRITFYEYLHQNYVLTPK